MLRSNPGSVNWTKTSTQNSGNLKVVCYFQSEILPLETGRWITSQVSGFTRKWVESSV